MQILFLHKSKSMIKYFTVQFLSFALPSISGTIDLKLMGLTLLKSPLFKYWGCFSLLNWTGVLTLFWHKCIAWHCMEYLCHVWVSSLNYLLLRWIRRCFYSTNITFRGITFVGGEHVICISCMIFCRYT